MIQAISKLMTFDDFLEWKPENGRYELDNGVIVEMQTTGKHTDMGRETALPCPAFSRIPYLIKIDQLGTSDKPYIHKPSNMSTKLKQLRR